MFNARRGSGRPPTDTSALRMDVSAKRELLQLLHYTPASIIHVRTVETRLGVGAMEGCFTPTTDEAPEFARVLKVRVLLFLHGKNT